MESIGVESQRLEQKRIDHMYVNPMGKDNRHVVVRSYHFDLVSTLSSREILLYHSSVSCFYLFLFPCACCLACTCNLLSSLSFSSSSLYAIVRGIRVSYSSRSNLRI